MNALQGDPAPGGPAATAGSAAGGRTRREAMLADGTGVREVGAEVPAFQGATAEVTVTALYQAHALRLIRLAHIMVGDRGSAEDIVQEAFCGLYRRWGQLSDSSNAQRYLHSSVLNGCRSALRRKLTRRTSPSAEPSLAGTQIPEISAETAVLSGEERQQVMAAGGGPPVRRRRWGSGRAGGQRSA